MTSSYFQDRVSSPMLDGTNSILSPTSPSAHLSVPRSNALQNRITSVLSASYADLEIRDALSILDERGVTNTTESRRNLRLDVQEELIACNGSIIQDFGKVAAQLKRIGTAISTLDASCVEMQKHINAANRETGPMLEEAKSILGEKHQVEQKKQILDAFTTHFVLSEADLATLTSTAEPVDNTFFTLLARVKKIHSDSQILLASSNQRLGLEILDQSSKTLNAAFQKLHRWTQREFKSLDLENPQLSASIRRALRVLAERPSLFQSCLDFFAEAREHVLSANFYAALTGEPVDPSHPMLGKAIELSAHDPLRYVSDMLAWAHNATVSEREALEPLFLSSESSSLAATLSTGRENEPWNRADINEGDESEEAFNPTLALQTLLNRTLTSVFRQLRLRTDQVLSSHPSPTLAYRISNLLTFYTTIFTPLLTPSSPLLTSTLTPLATSALRTFQTLTTEHLESLTSELTTPPPLSNLSPPPYLTSALTTLATLASSLETTAPTSPTSFTPILKTALDPYLAALPSQSAALAPPAREIYPLNTLLAVHATLRSHPCTAPRAAALQLEIDSLSQTLQRETRDWMLRASGLAELGPSLSTPADLDPYYADPTPLLHAARRLDAFLPGATDEARGFLAQLADRQLVARAVEGAVGEFLKVFEGVEEAVLRADEGMEREREGDGEVVWLREVWPRTAAEVAVLLA